MAKILLTRPKKSSAIIAKNLAAKKIDFLIQPLFSIAKIKNLQPINQSLQAVLITSSNAVFALEKLAIKKDVLIFAVGKKTADKIAKIGFNNIVVANNSADDLLNLATKKLSKNNGLIIYLSGEIITLDLAQKLREQEFATKKIIVYKSKENKELSKQTIDEINNGNISEIWLYSKNSVKIFYQLVKKHNLLVSLPRIKILCLSQKIADFAQQIFIKNNCSTIK